MGDGAIFGFNPRARAGRDLVSQWVMGLFLVSIHAPARGATRPEVMQVMQAMFQSTRPRGARRPWRVRRASFS